MNFFKKMFGIKKEQESPVEALLKSTTEEIISKGGFDLSFDLTSESSEDGHLTVSINFSGADEEILKDRKGQVLDSLQLILKRVLQHNFPEDRTSINLDCGGYREETEQALIERAEHLKNLAIDQGKSVYYRALPPKERKVVHQYLSKDPRIKSKSLGEGLYKKIKIFPVKSNGNESVEHGD